MKSPSSIFLSLAAVALLAGCGKSSKPVSAVPDAGTPTLDTTPPPVPEGLSVTSDPVSGSERIVWSPSAAPDVAKYQVYVYSPDPSREDSYVLRMEIEGKSTQYDLNAVSSPTTQFFRVRAVDGSGNLSGLSPALSVGLEPPSLTRDPDQGPLGKMAP